MRFPSTNEDIGVSRKKCWEGQRGGAGKNWIRFVGIMLEQILK